MKKGKNILIISILSIAILYLAFSGVLNSVVGISNNLDYSNNWKNQDLNTGSYVTEAYLSTSLPNETESISFVVDYDFETHYRESRNGKISVKYEAFNYKSGSYDILENNIWELKNYERESTKFRIDGQGIYSNGIPEYIANLKLNGVSNRYFGCADGMSIEEAKELNPQLVDESRIYICKYPGESYSLHDSNDDSDENWDIEYFPKLITLNNNYIDNNNILLKISVEIISGGLDAIYYNDFKIDIFDVKTNIIDTYNFDGEDCNYKAKYTYQTLDSDYYTINECEYSNGIIECYLDSQCNTSKENFIVECQKNICIEERDVFWNNIFPKNEEPVEEAGESQTEKSLNLQTLIPIILIASFILFAVIRKKKKK